MSTNSVYNSAIGKALAESESANDAAAFLYKMGQNAHFKLCSVVSHFCKGYTWKANVKSNVQRIAQKLQEDMMDNNT